MNPPTPTDEYMLFFRGPDWDAGLSLEKSEELMTQLISWMEGLEARGILKGGQPLAREGRIVSGARGRTVSDGPFAESKEAVGGYLAVRAASLKEAVAIAQACPTLSHGITVEVRPLLAECPCFQRVKDRLALATA